MSHLIESQIRKIIHVDMDAFFASVEQRDSPALRGQCVIVGGSPKSRGVVCAASYEARQFGVKSAMASAQAIKLCPQAHFIKPDFQKYHQVSIQLKSIFKDYSDQIEPLSLDEAYLDVTDNKKNILSATQTAKEIKSRIAKELDLIASCGVAHNKLLAKIASDYNKPNGLCVIKPHEAKDFMKNLPVSIIPGVGRVTQRKLEKHNILTCQDIWKSPQVHLTKLLGKFGPALYNYALGIDTRPVQAKRKRQSLGSEVTLAQDILDIEEINRVLHKEIDHLVHRLSEKSLKGKTITLKIKYHDFTTITRSTTLPLATDDRETIQEECQRLLKKTLAGKKKLRLIGVSMSQFDPIVMDALQLAFRF